MSLACVTGDCNELLIIYISCVNIIMILICEKTQAGKACRI